MIAHLTLIGGAPVFLLSQGRLGVEIFIFLSGFLMTLILKDDALFGRLKGFYIRRFFRIAPSFYLAVLLYVVFRNYFTAGLLNAEAIFGTPYKIDDLDQVVTWQTIGWHVSFLHGLFPEQATRIFGPAWSLSLEMQFYAVAPFCVWFLRRRPVATMSVLFVLNYVSNLLFGFYGRVGLLAQFPYPSFLPNRIFLFLLGGTYCVFLFERQRKNFVVFLVSALLTLPLVGLKSWVICLGLIGVLQLAVSAYQPGRLLSRMASSRTAHYLAEWSYGIYLYHMLVLGLVGLFLTSWERVLPRSVLWPAYATTVIVLSTLGAALIHHFYEKPTRSFGRRLSSGPNPPGPPAPPPAARLAPGTDCN